MIRKVLSYFQPKLIFIHITLLLTSCESSLKNSPWDVIDANTVLIHESDVPPGSVDNIYSSYFLVRQGQYLSSIQRSSKGDFDILYSYLLTKDDYDSLLATLDTQKLLKRILNGTEINEVKDPNNKTQLSFAYLDGIFVLSRSPFLVENALRVFKNKEERSFKKNNEPLFQFPLLKSDQGNIYINIENLSEVLGVNSPILKEISLVNELTELSVYDIKSNRDFLSLNGFSLGANSSLEKFQKQKPVILNIARYIPNYSNALVHFGISDILSFKGVLDSVFIKTFNFGSEIAFASTESSVGSITAFVEFKPLSAQVFNFITDYTEAYSNYEIRSVNGEALKKGFGRIFPDVLFHFCIVKDNYLIFSQSIEEMKLLIDAIESENTWGKTSDYQKFINKGLQESNVTLIFRRPDLFSESILRNHSGLADSLGLEKANWVSVQMSALDKHFYSNINFDLESSDFKLPEIKRNQKSSFLKLQGAVKFTSLVKNHNTGLQELLIQDSDLTLYLISLSEGVIWKRKLDGQIQSHLEQLDFYRNGKLQYYFVSKNELHIIDRLGRDVSGFPKSLNSSPAFSTLVDYDKNRDYRFLISSSSNEVSLLDKSGKNINEWGPKKFGKEIAISPEHMKIGGKDYFVIMLADGTVQIFNRKGDQTNLFYLKDKKMFSGESFLESGMSVETSYLYYLSAEGAIVKQNLKGDMISIQSLLRGKNSIFTLKRNLNKDDFNLYRIDNDKIVVFDKAGVLTLERQNSGSSNLEIQCYKLEGNRPIFSLYDIEQKLVQVFDQEGNNLIQTPLESEAIPLFGFGKSKSEFGIYSFPQNSVAFNTIR